MSKLSGWRSRRLRLRARGLILAVGVCVQFAAGAAAAQSDALIIPTQLEIDPSGKVTPSAEKLRIPRNAGPQADARLIALATEVESLDIRIAALKGTDNVTRSRLDALVEGRNIAVSELAAGRKLLLGTSAGRFPEKSDTFVSAFLAAVKQGLTARDGREFIAVTVSYAGSSKRKMAIEYQQFDADPTSVSQWSTHTAGQVLQTRTYRFRVSDSDTSKDCTELVPVLSEPTIRGICARFSP